VDWLLASLIALLDELSEKPTGQFREFLDERSLGLAAMLSEGRRDTTAAADLAAEALRDDAELILALTDEIKTLNREVADLAARNVVLAASEARLELQHQHDRAHIRELIADMVRRDIR
jgi:hypothetical protein